MEQEITFDPTKLTTVGIDEVRANSWNPKDKETDDFKNVVESIKKYGQRQPIVVRENEGYEIVDGEQRWRACKELGYKKVIVYNEGKLEDKVAKELTLWYQVQVPFTDLSLAKMITKLTTDHGDAFVPFSAEKIEEMKELSNFDWDNYKKDAIPPTDDIPVMKTFIAQLTEDQYKVVQEALTKAKAKIDGDAPDGRLLEFIAIEYINTPEGQ